MLWSWFFAGVKFQKVKSFYPTVVVFQAFGEWIIVHFELRELRVLIRHHCYKLSLRETEDHVSGTVQFHVFSLSLGMDNVKTRDVSMHWVKDRVPLCVRSIVREFEFVKRDWTLHPVLPGGGGVRVGERGAANVGVGRPTHLPAPPAAPPVLARV